jgi:MFS family permease
MMMGMLLLLCAMLVLAYAPSLLLLGTGSVLLQIAINVILAALSAIIPDQVPTTQRATISAFGGMAPLVGGLIGQILVTQVIKDLTASFLILAIVSVALLITFSLVLHEQRLPKQAVAPFRLADIPKSLWLNPRNHPDFARAWVARCFVFLASTTVINYLFYYLTANHVFPQAQVSRGVQLFYTVYVLSILVASLIFGKLSDTFQRRKPFVIIASLLMTVGILLLAVFPTWHLILAGAMVLGSGFGGYLSTDLALASQLLPEARNRGKDFGLINVAIFLPMVVASLLAGVTVGLFHSYTALFVVIAIGTVLAAGVILPIKQVS